MPSPSWTSSPDVFRTSSATISRSTDSTARRPDGDHRPARALQRAGRRADRWRSRTSSSRPSSTRWRSVASSRAPTARADGRRGSGRVEAPYLQLVMERLWEAEDRARITGASDSRRSRSSAEPRRSFALTSTSASRRLSREQRDVAARIFNHLVTPSGHEDRPRGRRPRRVRRGRRGGASPVLGVPGRQADPAPGGRPLRDLPRRPRGCRAGVGGGGGRSAPKPASKPSCRAGGGDEGESQRARRPSERPDPDHGAQHGSRARAAPGRRGREALADPTHGGRTPPRAPSVASSGASSPSATSRRRRSARTVLASSSDRKRSRARLRRRRTHEWLRRYGSTLP